MPNQGCYVRCSARCVAAMAKSASEEEAPQSYAPLDLEPISAEEPGESPLADALLTADMQKTRAQKPAPAGLPAPGGVVPKAGEGPAHHPGSSPGSSGIISDCCSSSSLPFAENFKLGQ